MELKMSKYLCACDFGHGGGDSGAVGHGLKESDLIREIGRNLVYDLTRISDGQIAVICISPLDTDIKLRASNTSRAMLANKGNADVFIALHINAASSEKAKGFEVIYCDGSKKGVELAQCVHDALLYGDNGAIESRRGRPISWGEVGRGFPLTVLSATKMPAIVIECGFITNAIDASEMVKSNIAISDCIAKGVWAFLKSGF
jgi:N-acetylmuramoyl-L-alanine amidase